MPTDLATLREHHEQLELRVDNFRLEKTLALIEGAEQHQVVREAWGEPLSQQELYGESYTGRGLGAFYQTTINDRADGSFFPIYQTETDLANIRAMARAVCNFTAEGVSIQQNLVNYTLGSGYDYDVAANEGGEQIARIAKQALAEFLDGNDWPAVEREFFLRSREDGEAFLSLYPGDGNVYADFLEPDQVRRPAGERQLDDWLDLGISPSWSFGVHTRSNRTSESLGYHVVRDGAGGDWDYCPAADAQLATRMRGGLVEHMKLNVTRSAKRGVSDYYPVYQKISKADKLLGNMLDGGALQAAIAWVVENAGTTGQGDIGNLPQYTNYEYARPKLGSATRNVRHFPSGSIVETSAGRKYQPGPMGSQRAPHFVEMIQAGLRIVGSRWAMPEYMVSSDASNANYSSTLVAESPFIKGREHDQIRYVLHFRRVLWKVLALLHAYGRIPGTWEEVKAAVNVVVKPPKVATRDEQKQVLVDQALVQMGAKAVESVAEDHGLDYAAEREKGAAPQEVPSYAGPQQQVDPLSEETPANVATTQALNGAQITAAKEVLLGLAQGTVGERTAFELLTAVGIQQQRARLMVQDTVANTSLPKEVSGDQSSEGGEFGQLGRRQFKNNTRAVQDILDDVVDGTKSRTLGLEMLVAVGTPRARAETLIADALNEPSQESLSEERRTWLSHVARKVKALHAEAGGP